MKLTYLAHITELTLITVLFLYIFVLASTQSRPSSFNVSTASFSSPPNLQKGINSTKDIDDDLTAIGCRLIIITDLVRSAVTYVGNYSDFRWMAYNTKLVMRSPPNPTVYYVLWEGFCIGFAPFGFWSIDQRCHNRHFDSRMHSVAPPRSSPSTLKISWTLQFWFFFSFFVILFYVGMFREWLSFFVYVIDCLCAKGLRLNPWYYARWKREAENNQAAIVMVSCSRHEKFYPKPCWMCFSRQNSMSSIIMSSKLLRFPFCDSSSPRTRTSSFRVFS